MKKISKRYKEYFEDLDNYVDENGNKLTGEASEYINRFYLEMYNDLVSFEEPEILKSPDMIVEARKNQNATKLDAMRVSKARDSVSKLSEVDKPHNRAFMEAMSNECDWMTAFKIHGYQFAASIIVIQTRNDIENKIDSIDNLLLNMLYSFRKLRNVHRKDKYEKGKHK